VNLNDQVVLITGGGGVLCSTMAQALAVCGAKIAVADLKQDAAEAVAAKIRAEGGTRSASRATCSKSEPRRGQCEGEERAGPGGHPDQRSRRQPSKGTTSLEYLRKEDLAGSAKELIRSTTLDPKGIEFRVQSELPRHAAADAGVSRARWPPRARERSSMSLR